VVKTKKSETVKRTSDMISSTSGLSWRRFVPWVSLLLLVAMIIPALHTLAQAPRVIQIAATHDNKFKVAGAKEPVITVKAGEVIKFRITAQKGPATSRLRSHLHRQGTERSGLGRVPEGRDE
jgi:hypothetical protein